MVVNVSTKTATAIVPVLRAFRDPSVRLEIAAHRKIFYYLNLI